jgi:hypothetical protein
MAFLVQAMVGELQMLHAFRSSFGGNNSNSVHTDPPVFEYPSNIIVHPDGRKSLLVLDV